MILLLGTRRGERKARLSSKDLGTLTEIKLTEDAVIDANITNMRVLYIVVQENESIDEDIAQRACQVVKRNGALAEAVRIVKSAGVINKVNGKKPSYILLQECNCAAVRIK